MCQFRSTPLLLYTVLYDHHFGFPAAFPRWSIAHDTPRLDPSLPVSGNFPAALFFAIDCSQSPYFSVGFSRPVRFNGTALVCKSERDLGRVSKLPRGAGAGVSIVRGMDRVRVNVPVAIPASTSAITPR